MSSVWDFIRRHRGKLITGGVVVGGLWAANIVAQRNRAQIESWLNTQQQAVHFSMENRKSYIFESQQRTCDDSVLELLPDLSEKIKRLLDVEAIKDLLEGSNDDEPLSPERKIELWNQMKSDSVTRLLVAAYAYSILVLALKIQVSILSSELYKDVQSQSASTSKPTDVSSSLTDSFWSMLGYNSAASEETPVKEVHSSNNSASRCNTAAQQLFLQCIQYFILRGVDDLKTQIGQVVDEVMADVTLKSPMDINSFRTLVDKCIRHIDSADTRNHSYLVVPLTSEQDAFSMPQYERLEPMLNRMKASLQSEQATGLLKQMVRMHVKEVESVVFDELSDKPTPVAKLVPRFTKAFDSVSSTELSGPVHQLLCAHSLHTFTLQVFDEQHL